MGLKQKFISRLTLLPIVFGLFFVTGSYRGHTAAGAQQPILGVALILAGIGLKGGLWYYNKD